jgi:uncharacterized protein with HEPN domain
MPETDLQSIASIIKEIDNVSGMMAGKSQADLEDDLVLERAVCMTLGLIGGKASKVSAEFKTIHNEIPWPKLIALRNRIVHSYEDLDFDIIYLIVSERLPEFKNNLNLFWMHLKQDIGPITIDKAFVLLTTSIPILEII